MKNTFFIKSFGSGFAKFFLRANTLTLLVSVVIWTVSCRSQEEAISVNPESSSANVDKVTLENGYLVFNDYEYFKKLVLFRDQSLIKDYEALENRADFESINEVYDKALQAQTEFVQTNGERREWCSFIKENQSSFVFENGGFEPNAPKSPIMHIINKDGIVKAGGVFYQFTKKYDKIMTTGGDVKMLTSASKSSPTDHIYVASDRITKNSSPNGKTNEQYSYVEFQEGAGVPGLTEPDRVLVGKTYQSMWRFWIVDDIHNVIGYELSSGYGAEAYYISTKDRKMNAFLKTGLKISLSLIPKVGKALSPLVDLFDALYSRREIVDVTARSLTITLEYPNAGSTTTTRVNTARMTAWMPIGTPYDPNRTWPNYNPIDLSSLRAIVSSEEVRNLGSGNVTLRGSVQVN